MPIIKLDTITTKSDTCATMPIVKLQLEKVLKERNKTIYALAKETEISYSTVHKMAKKDIQSIDLAILDKICHNLKCLPNDLIPVKL